MDREFLIGARSVHNDRMLRLGLEQFAVVKAELKSLLAAYEQRKTEELARQISEECMFISLALEANLEMANTGKVSFVVFGNLPEASRYMTFIEEAEAAIQTERRSAL